MKHIIKDKRGGIYLEAAFVIMVLMWLIAIMTAIIPIFAQINRINTYANHVARILSVEGGLTAEAEYRISEYQSNMGLEDVGIDYSNTDFFD